VTEGRASNNRAKNRPIPPVIAPEKNPTQEQHNPPESETVSFPPSVNPLSPNIRLTARKSVGSPTRKRGTSVEQSSEKQADYARHSSREKSDSRAAQPARIGSCELPAKRKPALAQHQTRRAEINTQRRPDISLSTCDQARGAIRPATHNSIDVKPLRRLSALAVTDACSIATLPATQFATALTGFLDAHSLTTPDEHRPANQKLGKRAR
jgi:hypothetical protein